MDSETNAIEISWYAVQVRPSQAQVRHRQYAGDPLLAPFRVEAELQKRGFETFVPRRAVYRLKNRYTKVKQARVYPLLTGWAFVGWAEGDNRWHDLGQTPGVVGVAGDGGVPKRIPGARIEALRRRWQDGLVKAHERERFMRSRKEYVPGSDVRVLEGPFAGSVCKVIEVRGAEAKILLSMFGAEREIGIEAMRLEAA